MGEKFFFIHPMRILRILFSVVSPVLFADVTRLDFAGSYGGGEGGGPHQSVSALPLSGWRLPANNVLITLLGIWGFLLIYVFFSR